VLIEDVGTVAEFFVTVPRLAMQGAIVLGCLGYLATLSVRAFVFAACMMLLGSAVHYAAVRHASQHLEQARRGEDVLYEHFRGLFAGAKELKLNVARRHSFLRELLGQSVESVRRLRTRGLLVYVAAGSWGAFLFFVVIGGVIFALGAVSDVESSVRSGYALMFLYMMHPMEALLEAIPEVSRTRVALTSLQEIGVGALTASTRPVLPALVPFEGLRLAGVTHSYRREREDGVFVLGPLELVLCPGEITFLIGGNGSGKTTLAKLLVGLYVPEQGQVLLNGMSVTAETRDAYRQLFSGVFADFHLFDSLLGLTGSKLDERGRELLSALHLDHKVSIEAGVFSTTELSRGQQKRLALLVACLEDRPVYVFDEWAADQDPAYKQVFYTQVLPWLRERGKAVLVVTHDDRYFHLADHCLKLDSGKLCPRVAKALTPPRADGQLLLA
jgi:putative ATP-binding cassette transporter